MGSESEVSLLARCRRGEAAAWDELFDLHYAAAGRFILQLGNDLTREDAEEICQEVFLAVIRHLRSFNKAEAAGHCDPVAIASASCGSEGEPGYRALSDGDCA